MKERRRIFLLAVFLILCLPGCGYTTGSLLPSNLKTIHVEDFANKIDISAEPSDKDGYKIYRVGIETDVTKAIIDQFIFDGHLRIVERKDADLVLSGELVDYYKQPLRYDKFDNIEEYRIIITVNMELKDMADEKVMWKESGFIGYETYTLTGDFATSEDAAREKAVKDLAGKIVEKVIEGW